MADDSFRRTAQREHDRGNCRQSAVTLVAAIARIATRLADQPKLKFDIGYDPIVVGSTLLLGSSFDDSVTAWSTETGEELWRFYALGPVRFAPLVWEGKVYFVSDDGYLYCLKLDDGSLQWKFRGGPEDRLILGNERLISMWPARGAPVIAEGKIYFTAGIWPFMGIFIHALMPRRGSNCGRTPAWLSLHEAASL